MSKNTPEAFSGGSSPSSSQHGAGTQSPARPRFPGLVAAVAGVHELRAQFHLRRNLLEQALACESPINVDQRPCGHSISKAVCWRLLPHFCSAARTACQLPLPISLDEFCRTSRYRALDSIDTSHRFLPGRPFHCGSILEGKRALR